MKHFSTLLCVLALGLTIQLSTACTKQTIPPPSNNTVVKDNKVIQQDSTTTQSSGDHGCGNGHGTQG